MTGRKSRPVPAMPLTMGRLQSERMTPEEAYHTALSGNYSPLVELERAFANASGKTERAWHAAAVAGLSLVTDRHALDPAAVDPVAGASDELRAILSRACVDGALLAWLELDTARLEGFRAVQARLGDVPQTAALFGDLLSGHHASALTRAHQVAGSTSTPTHAVAKLDATAVEALVLLSQHNWDEATHVARRASRMAGTEGILQREYLANLVLARVRRRSGRPHAAARIIEALTRVVPPPWRAWLGWEGSLCGGNRSGAVDPNAWSHHLLRIFDAAERGDLRALARSRQAVESSVTAWADLREETQELTAAIDPTVPDEDLDPWLRGASEDTPPTVRGLLVPELDALGHETAGVVVCVGHGRTARRLLRCGLPLLPKSHAPLPYNLKASRTFTALASLALAGPQGLGDAELFAAVYGFGFVPRKHQGSLRTLIYRMRAETENRAAIDRSDGRCTLIPLAPLSFPDPRCTPDLEEMILHALATRETNVTARDLARTLSVPIRTIQRTVSGLVDLGCCEQVQRGRNTFYRMEDTTFFEPTITRLTPQLPE